MNRLVLLALFIALAARAADKPATAGKPNIVIVLADDMGWRDTGYHGNTIVKTPHLDDMASKSVQFDYFYPGQQMCSPGRFAIMTGRNPCRSGLHHLGAMRPQEITVAQALKRADYHTGQFGKWHLGDTITSPAKMGFDKAIWALNYFDLGASLRVGDTEEKIPLKGDTSVAVMDLALDWMREQARKPEPFLAYVCFGSPHNPHRPTEEFKALYKDQPARMQNYWGEVSGIDTAVGNLRAELRKLGIADNTIVWFTSDNGGVTRESQDPAGRGKGNIGVRTQGLLEWPARVKQQVRTAVVVGHIDIYPTLLDITGVTVPNQPPVDGVTLVPLLAGKMTARPKPIGLMLWPGGHGGAFKQADFVAETQGVWIDRQYKLVIGHGGKQDKRAYRRSLDYSTGLARIQCADGDTRYEQWAFVSRADNLFVLQLSARGGKKLNGRVQLLSGKHSCGDRLQNIHPPAADGKWLSCRFGFTLNNGGYEVLALVNGDGQVRAEADGAVCLSNTSSVTVLLRIQRLTDYGASKMSSMKEELTRYSKETFEALLARHTALHSELYERAKIDLGGAPQERAMPAETLWEKTYGKKSTPALLERVFDAGRYEILSSTGYGPPNLQGIWAVGGCPWRGDFTHNGNVPTAIGNLLNGNMPELMLAYTGYLESLMDHHRANAKQFFGARGILLASRTHLHGCALHCNNKYPHEFWVAGAPWAAGFFYDYYLYTGDEEFLRKHALPWMEQCALFFEDFLVEDRNGTYEFIPGYSPEIGTGMNATMDVAAVRQLLRNLIQAYTILGMDKQQVAKWEKMLTKMPKYRINKGGAFAEWIDPKMGDSVGHRHCSHFLPLWFGLDPAIAGDPQLLEAARKAVREKAAARKSSGIMAFGTAMTGWAAASLGDAETVDTILDNLSTRYYYPTFASSHNAGSKGPEVFNADISGGLPALMIEMLVQSQPGELTLLSALSDRLKSGTLKGALCRGQVTIEELAWSPERVKVNLRSPQDQELTLRVKTGDGWKTATVRLSAGKPAEHTFGNRYEEDDIRNRKREHR